MSGGMSLMSVWLCYTEQWVRKRIIYNYHLDNKYEMMDMETFIEEWKKLEKETK
jgi:hypothetical protein